MKKFFATLLLLLPFAMNAQAQTDELLLEFKTSLYDEKGADNAFTLALGSTTNGVYVDIDCGYGREEFEVTVAGLDEDSNISSSSYGGKVSKEGIVRVYGNPAEIDYVNASGCSVTEITFHPDLNLQLLNLEHNKLGKLNLNDMEQLQVIYLLDNPFDEEPFNITCPLNNLAILEIGEIENIVPDLDFTLFPNLMSVDAYHTKGLKSVNTSQCPYLYRLSLEMTSVEHVDVSNNLNLMVLNVCDTRVNELDLSKNAELQELYCTHGTGSFNTDVKFTELNLACCPKLEYLFCGGNNISQLDLSHNPKLVILSARNNSLTSINLDNNPLLYTVNLDHNKMTFATLPEPKETWGEYYYDEDDLPMNDTYKVGDVIDFSAQVNRPGTTTTANLYSSPKDNPIDLQKLDASYFTYDNGKVTLLKEHEDQLYLIFSNSLFPDYDQYAEPFRVVTAEQFGKDVKAFTLSSPTAVGVEVKMAIGIVGASAENPVTVQVDLGDGEPKPVVITEERPEGFNIVEGRTGASNIEVYVPQDHYVSTLKVEDLPISKIDLSNLLDLRVLSLVNADLYDIDLTYNAKLEDLTITGNPNLTKIDFRAKTQYYYKGGMGRVNLSHNALTEVKTDDYYMMRYVDFSYNQLTEFDVTDGDYMIEVDLSHNNIEVLQFNNSIFLEKAILSDNQLYYLYITDEAPLSYLDITGNTFYYGSIPSNLWRLDDAHYIYAPQQEIPISSNAPSANLTKYNYEADGAVTQYTWKSIDGQTLTEGTDYTNENGKFQFLAPVLGKTIYCELTHAAYPQLTGDKVLRTNNLTVIQAPTIELASFVTTEEGESPILTLSATKKNTTLYIDWAGDGNVTPYLLEKDNVLEAQAYTKKGATVRVLASNEDDNFRIFSVSNASMSQFDGSGLTQAVLISVENAGLSNITLPASSNLSELRLSGNKLTNLDLTQFPNLYYLAFNSNNLQSFDFGQAPQLGLAYLANNKLTSVTFNNNRSLWNLDLGSNQFSEISFEGAPNIEQLWLNNNKFETLDLSYLSHLLVLDLVGNYFTFASLENFATKTFNVFRYGNQADISATAVGNVVDLSSQAVCCDSLTTYRWFVGKPVQNDDGELEGIELTEGVHFNVEGGVTTFTTNQKQENLVCVMTNAALPKLKLYTLPICINEVSSLREIEDTDNADGPSKEWRDGRVIVRSAGKVYNLFGVVTE